MRVIRHERQPYPDAVAEQEAEVTRILEGASAPCVILTEHPPLFTIGTSGSEQDVLRRDIGGVHIDLFETGRGGETTYHGPGQLVCYMLADLNRERDLHRHVRRLEEIVIRTLADFDIVAGRSEQGIGVWVEEKKIAAVGVRCRKWISYHGIALNIEPNLDHFGGIVACGMRDAPVTSMRALGVDVSRPDVEAVLLRHARSLFDSGAGHEGSDD